MNIRSSKASSALAADKWALNTMVSVVPNQVLFPFESFAASFYRARKFLVCICVLALTCVRRHFLQFMLLIKNLLAVLRATNISGKVQLENYGRPPFVATLVDLAGDWQSDQLDTRRLMPRIGGDG
jgi:hypothetical protein